MGRECRKVPAKWEHPKDANGRCVPLHDGDLAAVQARWDESAQKYAEGFIEDYGSASKAWKPRDFGETPDTYQEWDGARPTAEEYMPQWPAEQRTHFQMYETTTEGTPISPPMPDAESLARWLADNGASAFGRRTATYEQWIAMIDDGSAPSMAYSPEAGPRSGVEAAAPKKGM